MSSISIIGTGNMARTIGARAIAGGNTVEIVGRDPSKAADLANALGGGATSGAWGAVPAGDIVVVALLHAGVVPVVASYGDALAGKILVDISNPFNSTFDGLAHGEVTSVAEEVAKVAPASARVVKAFNTIFRPVLEKGRPDVFVAGDSAEAKASVAGSAMDDILQAHKDLKGVFGINDDSALGRREVGRRGRPQGQDRRDRLRRHARGARADRRGLHVRRRDPAPGPDRQGHDRRDPRVLHGRRAAGAASPCRSDRTPRRTRSSGACRGGRGRRAAPAHARHREDVSRRPRARRRVARGAPRRSPRARGARTARASRR